MEQAVSISKMDPHYREHPMRYSHTLEVVLKAGVRNYFLPELDAIKNRHIIGLVVHKQDVSGEKSITGRAYAADAVIYSAYITLKVGNKDTLSDHPIKHFFAQNRAAEYGQLSLPTGLDTKASNIRIADGVTIVDDTVIQFTIMSIFEDNIDC